MPSTGIGRFLMGIDHGAIDAITKNPKNLKILAGKWMIYVDRKDADDVWKQLSHHIESGRLPCRAKISTARENAYLIDKPKSRHLICVYTPNFLWRENVRKVRLLLKDCGFRSKLYYRPDIITVLEMGHVNGTRFKPSIFTYLRKHRVRSLKIKHRYFG